jgi:hypothetical protein
MNNTNNTPRITPIVAVVVITRHDESGKDISKTAIHTPKTKSPANMEIFMQYNENYRKKEYKISITKYFFTNNKYLIY